MPPTTRSPVHGASSAVMFGTWPMGLIDIAWSGNLNVGPSRVMPKVATMPAPPRGRSVGRVAATAVASPTSSQTAGTVQAA